MKHNFIQTLFPVAIIFILFFHPSFQAHSDLLEPSKLDRAMSLADQAKRIHYSGEMR